MYNVLHFLQVHLVRPIDLSCSWSNTTLGITALENYLNGVRGVAAVEYKKNKIFERIKSIFERKKSI